MAPTYEALRVTQVWSLPNNNFAVNVLHWSINSIDPFTADMADSLGSQVRDAFANSGLDGVVNNGVSIVSEDVTDLRDDPYVTFPANGTHAGQDASTAMPWQMAACISLHTSHGGRRGRGRIFIPGLCEDSNTTDGVLASTTIATLIDYGEALKAIDDADGSPVFFGVLSRMDASIYNVTTVSCDNRWDVQRRRANVRQP